MATNSYYSSDTATTNNTDWGVNYNGCIVDWSVGDEATVYVGGDFSTIARWDGSVWHQISEAQEKEHKNMRGLFFVYIVDPILDVVISITGPIVAKDSDNARLKAVQAAGEALTKDIDDYDIIVCRLGDVRKKKEVQEVKVVD